MTETAAGGSQDRPAKKKPGASGARKAGLFARIVLFIRQVMGELGKVVTPTRQELINYTIVVLVFVTVMMVITNILDFAFTWGTGVVFGGTGAIEN